MQSELGQYQEALQKFKELVDLVTMQAEPQIKLAFTKIASLIHDKQHPFYAHYDSLKHLCDNFKEAKGKVILHFACARGDTAIVKYLIEDCLLDHTIKDKEGNTPFFTAVQHGHLLLTRYFLQEKGYSPNESKEGGTTCLHLASNHNHVQLMEYFIERGADIQRISVYGKPINWAVGSSNYQATKLLLSKGAHPNGDSTGSTPSPLILAVDFNQKRIYDLLIASGADVNVLDPNGYPVIFVASEKGCAEIVKDLLLRGANPNISVNGKTALYVAFEKQHWDVVALLKEKEPNYQEIERQVSEKLSEEASKAVRTEEDRARAEELKISGNKLYSDKQYELALKEYTRALETDGENQVIHRNLAACLLALNRFPEALVHCHFAKRKDPKNIKTIYRESLAYIGMQNYIEASSSLWECSVLDPSNAYFRSQFQKYVALAKKRQKVDC